MEPLSPEDPTEILGHLVVGRLWQVGSLRSYAVRRDGHVVEMQVIELSSTPYGATVAEADVDTRFAAAVSELSGIVHPAVPQVLDAGCDDERIWLMLEFADTSTLADGLASGKPVSAPDWQRLAQDLIGALGTIHDAGWTSGQLSPQRVRHSSTNGFVIPNPGLAMLLRTLDLPSPGLLSGSIMWLAPEQLRQADPTPASDLFTAGALLAYAGTARLPWGEAGTPTSQIVQRLASAPPDTTGLTFEQQQRIALLTAKGPEYRTASIPATSTAPMAGDPTTMTATGIASTHATASPEVIGAARQAQQVTQPTSLRERVTSLAKQRGALLGSVGAVLVVAIVASIVLATRGGDPSVPSDQTASGASAPSSASQAPAAPTSPKPPSPTPTLPPPTLTTQVDYKPDAIPDQTFDGTATWEASLCIGDSAFEQAKYVDRVRLDRKGASGWSDTGSKATALTPGRCAESGDVELQIGFTEPTPREAAVNKGWSGCHDYRVIVPETPRRRGTAVDVCVTIRADRS